MMEIIDEELREAARSGNVEFLQKCVDDNKPNHYYLTLFPRRVGDAYYSRGNIFHIAVDEQQEEWIREAINLLPLELVHQLICQPYPEVANRNPLHSAAHRGNLPMVKMFLNAFTSHHLPLPNPPPWLLKDSFGFTPCHLALFAKNEECGLEILRMDKELLSNMLDDDGWSLLARAIQNGLEKVAMEIISSPYSFSASAPDGESALFYMHNCSSSSERREEICNSLLKKMPELIRKKRDSDGSSIFHRWAMIGELWPFRCLLESSDIILDIRHVFVELISATNDEGKNPLHYLPLNSISIEVAQIGKLLIDTYKHEHGEEAQSSSNISPRELQYPWLVKDKRNKTPLDYAVDEGKEELAYKILIEDKNALKTCQENVLFVAIEKRFDEEVLLKILEIVNEEKLTHLLTNDQKLNALHLAPKCKRTFCERLIEQHPKLIEGVSKEGERILHTWVKIGQVWPFEYLLNNSKIEHDGKSHFILSLRSKTNKNNNPLHVVATCTNESTLQIVKLLLQAFKDLTRSLWTHPMFFDTTPWIMKNKDGEGALHVAIRCQKDQKLALYLLSLQPDGEDDDLMAKWLDFYAPNEHSIIFLAIQRNFFDVVKMIFSKLNKESRSKYLQDSANDNNNVLHLASTCTDAEFAQLLVEEAPEFISQPNKNGITPLELACEVGATRIVKAMLEKDPSVFDKVPLAWVKACENGHESVIQAFIDCCPKKFSDHCKDHNDTPLHRIKLRNLTRYEDFLKIQYIKDLINVKDSTGATPLHKAIKNNNIFLAEALLKMDNIEYNIKDDTGKTAREMLVELLEQPLQQTNWAKMCKDIGFDPALEMSYFQRETDLLAVRDTLSVVAALLATITFTVGFTLPGGLNQETGEALIVNKAVFAVFLISDTLAMCFSMVVLICLIWSMVLERNESLYLIDRSVWLLRLALYLTLLAFVTGVYIVISPKLFWAAIVIIVLCSLVLGVSLNRNSLYKVFKFVDNLYSSVTKKIQDPMHRMELGLPLLCHHGESSNQNRTSTREGNEGALISDSGGSSYQSCTSTSFTERSS